MSRLPERYPLQLCQHKEIKGFAVQDRHQGKIYNRAAVVHAEHYISTDESDGWTIHACPLGKCRSNAKDVVLIFFPPNVLIFNYNPIYN